MDAPSNTLASQMTLEKPIDVPTRETVAFLASHLHLGAEVLEVGCGKGHVASELSGRGYPVIGLDSNPEVIAQAQTRGVRAVVASWPAFDGPPVDAIALTRSLHHISPLREAVRKARELLRPAGSLLVEDFAFDEMNAATIQWFLNVLRSQSGTALIRAVPGELVTDLLRANDPVVAWRQSRVHELHSMAAMKQAVEEYFTVRETQSVPYLYRYLVPVLTETPDAAAFVETVLQKEARLGQRREIVLIGRRIVGT